MSIIPFDCSQFITFNTNINVINKENIKSIYNNRGFDVKVNNEIDFRKLSYFSNDFLEVTIEIVDKEFLGNFEDWKDISEIPFRIQNFAEATEELVNTMDAIKYKMILVEYVSSSPNQDAIARKSFESNIVEELFYASRYNFELYGNVYIFSQESE